jgi:hypothetical protein
MCGLLSGQPPLQNPTPGVPVVEGGNVFWWLMGNGPPKPSWCILLKAAWHGWWQQLSLQSRIWCVCCGFCPFYMWWYSACELYVQCAPYDDSDPLRVSCILYVPCMLHMQLILHVPHMLLVPLMLCLPNMVCVLCILSSNSWWWSP